MIYKQSTNSLAFYLMVHKQVTNSLAFFDNVFYGLKSPSPPHPPILPKTNEWIKNLKKKNREWKQYIEEKNQSRGVAQYIVYYVKILVFKHRLQNIVLMM